MYRDLVARHLKVSMKTSTKSWASDVDRRSEVPSVPSPLRTPLKQTETAGTEINGLRFKNSKPFQTCC